MIMNKTLVCNQFSVLYQIRHCNQKALSISVCNKHNSETLYFDEIFEFQGLNFDNFRKIPFPIQRTKFKKTENASEVFLVGGGDIKVNHLKHIEIYSKNTNKWRLSAEMPKIGDGFCVTSFMRQLFVFTHSCWKYDVKHNKWSHIARMNDRRTNAGCTVFEGKIVVSGGICAHDYWNDKSTSVEAYDHHRNKWNCLPSMIQQRIDHFSVSMGNKMFVINKHLFQDFEVFDSISRKFNLIKSPQCLRNCWIYDEQNAYCIGNNIVLFCSSFECFFVYDTNNNNWLLYPFIPNEAL